MLSNERYRWHLYLLVQYRILFHRLSIEICIIHYFGDEIKSYFTLGNTNLVFLFWFPMIFRYCILSTFIHIFKTVKDKNYFLSLIKPNLSLESIKEYMFTIKHNPILHSLKEYKVGLYLPLRSFVPSAIIYARR